MYRIYCGWSIDENTTGVTATNLITQARYTFPDIALAEQFIDGE